MKPIHLLVLAGGFGTRLRAAVSEVPKPLAPVMNRPYLAYLIDSWLAQGVTSLTFLLHHQAGMIEEFLAELQKEGRVPGCRLQTLIEPQALGTGGAVAYAVQQFKMNGSFLVTNADTWLGTGIAAVANVESPAMAVVHVENTERYGHVRILTNKIADFEEKRDSRGPGWINAGLYHLHVELFRHWDGLPFSLERELFPELVKAEQLTAVSLETDFIDIGIPEDYFRFCRWIESKKVGVL